MKVVMPRSSKVTGLQRVQQDEGGGGVGAAEEGAGGAGAGEGRGLQQRCSLERPMMLLSLLQAAAKCHFSKTFTLSANLYFINSTCQIAKYLYVVAM